MFCVALNVFHSLLLFLQATKPQANDYINASLLKSLLPGSPDFISTQVDFCEKQGNVLSNVWNQGPLAQTCGDFWKMVMQQHVRVVVMATDLVEGGREKCHQYWPSTG